MAKLAPQSRDRARELRSQQTKPEKLLWRWFRAHRFSAYKFRRNHPIGPYFLDFYCAEANLSIELDGSQHGFADQRHHDQTRTEYLAKQGIHELRFWNHQLRTQPEAVRATIFQALQSRAPKPLS